MSNETAWERKAKIRKGEPIEQKIGEQTLIFYPVKMSDYEEFLSVKNAWNIRMTSLPVQYLTMPYLAALWAMDYDCAKLTGKVTGLFERIIRLLCLSLRLGQKAEEVLIETKTDDRRQLLSIILTQDGKTVKLTPKDFSVYVRPLVAEQNGIELPDESENPELVEAERILSENNASKLKFDIDTLISSVAYVSHTDEQAIDGWTVRQFERRKQAIDRDKMFTLYQQARLSGMVTFKGEIPYPSWCFDEDRKLSGALRTVAETGEHFKAIGNLGQAISELQNKK